MPTPERTPTSAPTAIPPTATSAPTATSEGGAAEGEATPEEGGDTEGNGDTEISAPEETGNCEPAPLPEAPVRPVDETDWVKGADPEDVEIIIYEYSDFQCPGCGAMYPVLQALLDDHPNVQLVYRHFPLNMHPHAQITAEAAEAAGAQGKFWAMHNQLFDRVSEWSQLSAEGVREKLTEYAEQLELDVERFNRELDEGTYTEKVEAQYQEATELQLPGTPSFLFNDVLYPSSMGLSYQGMVDFLGILENQETLFYDAPPEMTVTEDDAYEATLKTSQGDIVLEMLPAMAPVHVNSFIFLAEEGWYDGAEFFFVQDDFVAVTGDPTNTTIGYPGYYCTGETQPPSVFNRAGLVGMLANGQFFITLGTSPAEMLQDGFALVGEVTEGQEVLDALTRTPVQGAAQQPTADLLLSIDVVQQ
jgi:cyclophilin family peptidyl-prolyl cis-trans isomerase